MFTGFIGRPATGCRNIGRWEETSTIFDEDAACADVDVDDDSLLEIPDPLP